MVGNRYPNQGRHTKAGHPSFNWDPNTGPSMQDSGTLTTTPGRGQKRKLTKAELKTTRNRYKGAYVLSRKGGNITLFHCALVEEKRAA